MFNLLEKENVGGIVLGNKVRVSDPCYDINTWCAGTLENVLQGKYKCYSQKVDEGDWGIRVASIEVRHEDYLNVEPTELQNIDVGVDSGQAGIYDLDYFARNREDKNGDDLWYDRVCEKTILYVDNPKYVTFEKSEWCDETLAKIHKLFWDGSKVIDLFPYDDIIRFCRAEQEYDKSICSRKKVYQLAASTLDNKCLVSSSGDGDGSYHCFVGKNKENQIVSIKIDYYYGYNEDEEYEYEECED